MRKVYNLSFCIKVIFIAFIILINMSPAGAYTPKADRFDDVYVVINYTNARLSQIFELIEKQTSFSFAYDENDINLSKEIKLVKGQQRLKDVLDSIAKQAGLHFTEKQNIILVNPEAVTNKNNIKNVAFKIAASPISGVVLDATGNPLAGVTVSTGEMF